jgi:hemin transport system permease protein
VAGVSAAEPLGVTTTRAAAGDRSAALTAFGIRPGSGLGPLGSDARDGRVVLSRPAADALGVDRAGAHVTVAGRRLTVARVTGDGWFSHTPVMWTTLHDWQALDSGHGRAAPQQPHATVVALDVGDGAHTAAADARLGTKTVTRDDALSAIGSYTSENGSLRLMRGFLFAISALVIGAFFTVWTIQRGTDVAVLKALGASTGYLMRDALGQAAAGSCSAPRWAAASPSPPGRRCRARSPSAWV